jgi:hypothetical protein
MRFLHVLDIVEFSVFYTVDLILNSPAFCGISAAPNPLSNKEEKENFAIADDICFAYG